ncbi:hypothetical protein LUZ60_009316 [Juncus effusus]|nr:hypothetical protein LUZ60_009316 [Juncus effusus]
MEGTIVVFDFDETIIDCDSDLWIAGDLGTTEFFNNLLTCMSWNDASIRMMREFHEQGKSVDEIVKSLKKIPLSPHIAAAIKSSHALGCELKILSDANIFFIETVLKHQGLIDCFSEICTNPSFVDEEGKLIISPYHDFTSPHLCTLCPPNLCKGKFIEELHKLTQNNVKKRIIYVGDGKGDYCPSLKLTKNDIIMPRKNYSLWKLIHDNINSIDAEIHEWSDYSDLESLLIRFVTIESVSDSDSVHRENVSASLKSDATIQFLISRV